MSRSGRSITLINNSSESFTPTASGAIATFCHEVARAASESTGENPRVISRSSSVTPFNYADLTLLSDRLGLVSRALSRRGGRRVHRIVSGARSLQSWDWSRRAARAATPNLTSNAIVITNNDPELSLRIARESDAAVVHVFHNPLLLTPRLCKELRKSRIDLVAVSDFVGRQLVQELGVDTSRIRTVNPAVDHTVFRPRHEVATNEPPLVQFVGRTGIEKAPDILLKAALPLRLRGAAFRLRLIGSNHWDHFESDPYQEELAALAEELRQLGVSVEFAGHVGRAKLPKLVAEAQVHVTPSRWDEPFGLTTLEAMASGCAVVVSDTGGSTQLAGPGCPSFERDNVEALTDILWSLLSDRGHLERCKASALERSKGFSWQLTTGRLLEPYSIYK